MTVSAVLLLSALLTDSTTSFDTPPSSTSLSCWFLLNPAARTVLALSLYTSTFIFNTLAWLAASSSCAHFSSSQNSSYRYKPQHRGTEVTRTTSIALLHGMDYILGRVVGQKMASPIPRSLPVAILTKAQVWQTEPTFLVQ